MPRVTHCNHFVNRSKMAGAPTLYREEYNEQARKLCLIGATDKDLADFFEVEESTINNWKKANPEFLESIKAGKQLADSNVADRLYQRAIGFEHDAEEIKVVSDGMGAGSSIERVQVRKIYPPDTAAAIFWLKNRQRDKWRDKVETGFTDNEGKDRPLIYIPSNGRDELTNTGKG